MKIRALLTLTLLLLFASGGDAVLVPDNIVSFMHILYSTIPVIRKGTDSRLGFGFRFGPHADAQVVLELGPQRRTEPLTVVTTQQPTVYDSKRHVSLDHGQPLQDEHHIDEVVDNHLDDHRGRAVQLGVGPADATGGGGGEWLSRWRAGWSAPAATVAPSPTYAPSRAGRGMRIALAPVSTINLLTTAAAPRSTTPTPKGSARSDGAGPLRSVRAHPAAATPRTTSPPPVPTTASPPTAHLRGAVAALSSRTPPRTPLRTPPPPAPPRQGIILQVLRQLWQAGTRAVRNN
ncbi:GTPase activating protein homolog 2-like [Frankliniella occidentalis]|uniref:GTPase activating protein homolog 2-like n=1 Tax=Frankliniella occidentalis TaxID=133901 RepID=A0A6J1TIV9_FRAOC|nr:GTPase activating protein homolog 2-like [Frankliniella occidentalis]